MDGLADLRTHADPPLLSPVPRRWDLVGGVPVPLHRLMRDGLAALAGQYRLDTGRSLACCLPAGRGATILDGLRRVRTLDAYPDMLLSADYGSHFNRRFHDRHVLGGDFRCAQPGPVPAAAEACGLPDPLGHIAVYAVAPFVLLVDHRRLDGRPAPRRWADLLDPAFRGEVVLGGWCRPGEPRPARFNKHLLLSVHKAFGSAGVRRLARNTAGFVHSAEMPRIAGTGASVGGVYVLPWALADLCPRRAETEVIWPEDGALAFPLWLTVKDSRRDALDPLLRWVQGPELGRRLAANRYPPLCPGVAAAFPDAVFPVGARLSWLGWDYVRARGTADALRQACASFFEAWLPFLPRITATERRPACA